MLVLYFVAIIEGLICYALWICVAVQLDCNILQVRFCLGTFYTRLDVKYS